MTRVEYLTRRLSITERAIVTLMENLYATLPQYVIDNMTTTAADWEESLTNLENAYRAELGGTNDKQS